MIKEFKHKLGNTKTGFEFGTIEVKTEVISPISKSVPLDKESQHFKQEFDSIKTIEVKKKAGFKHADVVPVYLWNKFFCVSSKFKQIFEGKLKGCWYPTNNKEYFIFILDNPIDALDKQKTAIQYDENHIDKPYRYKNIEGDIFFKEAIEEEYLFTIPEFYGKYFVTSKFEALVRENNLIGFQFFKDLNVRRKDGLEFDSFRRKKYDEEGNCLE